MSYTSYLDIAQNIGLQSGDKIFISSDIRILMLSCRRNGEVFSCEKFIQSFINVVGEQGTIVFPTYNWDFCKGVPFDYFKTKSQVGSITNAALALSDFKRTKHPIYSFAVYGADKEKLCGIENASSFGVNSPFGFFYENHYKNLFIDVSLQNSATFVHFCEQKYNVSYRYNKNFTADYYDENNICSQKTYSMFVRYLEKNVISTINPMEPVFRENGAITHYTIDEIPYFVLDMHSAYDLIEQDILYNNSRNIAIFDGQDL